MSIVPVEHEVVAKKIPSFPLFFDHSLQLSNTAAKEDYNFHPTSIVDWLPLTVQWAVDHCELPEDCGADCHDIDARNAYLEEPVQ